MTSRIRSFSRMLAMAASFCLASVSASAQFNAAPYDNGGYGQTPQYSQQYPQQPAAKPSIVDALSALGIGRKNDQPNQAVQYGQVYGQTRAPWVAEPSDASMSAMIGRWTAQQRRAAHWMVPFDPQVQNYAQLNQELGLKNAASMGQAIDRLVQSYNRRANSDSKIAACLYNEGQVAAVFFLMSEPRRC